MKKKLLFLLVAFIVCHGLKAQNAGELNYFNLVLPDNTLVSYELANGVDIQFDDSIMMVNDLSFYMEDLVKYYFSEDEINATADHVADEGSYVAGDQLFVKSTGTGHIVVSDMLGRVVLSKPNCKECVVDLSTLARNTLYVIHVNSQTIKFIRR